MNERNQGSGIGLTLGGGGARGITHIHVISAFDELGLRPAFLSGTSIGSIIATAYASGMTGKEISEYACERLSNHRSLLFDFLGVYTRRLQPSLMKLLSVKNESNLVELLNRLLPGDFPENLEDLKLPVRIVATDFYAQKQHVFDCGPLLPALAASCAVPMLFQPVLIEGTAFIDGGTTNPVPFDILSDQANPIIAVDIIGNNSIDGGEMPSRLSVLTATSHIMQRAILRAKLEHHKPSLILQAPIEGIRVHEFMNIREILDRTEPFKDHAKREIEKMMNNSHIT